MRTSGLGIALVTCLVLISASVDAADDPILSESIREGRQALAGKDPDGAISAFAMAVHRAESFGEADPRLAESLFLLGRAYERAGRLLEAVPRYDRSMEIRRGLSGYGSVETARALEHTARAHAGVGERDVAVELFREAVTIREQVQGTDHPDLVPALNQLWSWSHATDPEAAESDLLRALAIARERSDTRLAGHLLSTLGQHQSLRGRHEEALESLLEALEIEERRADSNADIRIHRLGTITRELNALQRWDEAIERYRTILDEIRTHRGGEHHEVASYLLGLATTLRRNGTPELGERPLREALRISEGSWGADHRVTRNIRNQLIALLEDQGRDHGLGAPVSLQLDHGPAVPEIREIIRLKEGSDLPAAIELAEASLARTRSEHGEVSLATYDALWRLAGLLENRHRMDEAIAVGREALEVLREVAGTDDIRYRSGLGSLARWSSRAGRHEDAVGLYERQVALLDASGEVSPEVARTLQYLGGARRLIDPSWGAEEFERAAEIWEEVSGPESPERIRAMHMVVGAWISRGELAAAESLLAEMLHLLRHEDPARSIGVLQQLENVYMQTGRRDTALELRARIDQLRGGRF